MAVHDVSRADEFVVYITVAAVRVAQAVHFVYIFVIVIHITEFEAGFQLGLLRKRVLVVHAQRINVGYGRIVEIIGLLPRHLAEIAPVVSQRIVAVAAVLAVHPRKIGIEFAVVNRVERMLVVGRQIVVLIRVVRIGRLHEAIQDIARWLEPLRGQIRLRMPPIAGATVGHAQDVALGRIIVHAGARPHALRNLIQHTVVFFIVGIPLRRAVGIGCPVVIAVR